MEDEGPPEGDFWRLILSEGGKDADVYYPPDSAVQAHDMGEAFKAAAGHVRTAVTSTNGLVGELHSNAWRDRGGARLRDIVQNTNNGKEGFAQIAAGLDSLGAAYASYADIVAKVKDAIHDTYDRNNLIYLALGCNLPGVRGFYRRKLAKGVADQIAKLVEDTAESIKNPPGEQPDPIAHHGLLGGLWDSAVVQLKAFIGLAGFGDGFWSVFNAEQAWGNLGILVAGAAVYHSGPLAGKFVDDELFHGVLGETLTDFGKNFIAYDQWKVDGWHALGYVGGNAIGLLGTRGVGGGITRAARTLGKGAKASELTGFPKGVYKVGDLVREANLTGLAKYGLGKIPHPGGGEVKAPPRVEETAAVRGPESPPRSPGTPHADPAKPAPPPRPPGTPQADPPKPGPPSPSHGRETLQQLRQGIENRFLDAHERALPKEPVPAVGDLVHPREAGPAHGGVPAEHPGASPGRHPGAEPVHHPDRPAQAERPVTEPKTPSEGVRPGDHPAAHPSAEGAHSADASQAGQVLGGADHPGSGEPSHGLRDRLGHEHRDLFDRAWEESADSGYQPHVREEFAYWRATGHLSPNVVYHGPRGEAPRTAGGDALPNLSKKNLSLNDLLAGGLGQGVADAALRDVNKLGREGVEGPVPGAHAQAGLAGLGVFGDVWRGVGEQALKDTLDTAAAKAAGERVSESKGPAGEGDRDGAPGDRRGADSRPPAQGPAGDRGWMPGDRHGEDIPPPPERAPDDEWSAREDADRRLRVSIDNFAKEHFPDEYSARHPDGESDGPSESAGPSGGGTGPQPVGGSGGTAPQGSPVGTLEGARSPALTEGAAMQRWSKPLPHGTADGLRAAEPHRAADLAEPATIGDRVAESADPKETRPPEAERLKLWQEEPLPDGDTVPHSGEPPAEPPPRPPRLTSLEPRAELPSGRPSGPREVGVPPERPRSAALPGFPEGVPSVRPAEIVPRRPDEFPPTRPAEVAEPKGLEYRPPKPVDGSAKPPDWAPSSLPAGPVTPVPPGDFPEPGNPPVPEVPVHQPSRSDDPSPLELPARPEHDVPVPPGKAPQWPGDPVGTPAEPAVPEWPAEFPLHVGPLPPETPAGPDPLVDVPPEVLEQLTEAEREAVRNLIAVLGWTAVQVLHRVLDDLIDRITRRPRTRGPIRVISRDAALADKLKFLEEEDERDALDERLADLTGAQPGRPRKVRPEEGGAEHVRSQAPISLGPLGFAGARERERLEINCLARLAEYAADPVNHPLSDGERAEAREIFAYRAQRSRRTDKDLDVLYELLLEDPGWAAGAEIDDVSAEPVLDDAGRPTGLRELVCTLAGGTELRILLAEVRDLDEKPALVTRAGKWRAAAPAGARRYVVLEGRHTPGAEPRPASLARELSAGGFDMVLYHRESWGRRPGEASFTVLESKPYVLRSFPERAAALTHRPMRSPALARHLAEEAEARARRFVERYWPEQAVADDLRRLSAGQLDDALLVGADVVEETPPELDAHGRPAGLPSVTVRLADGSLARILVADLRGLDDAGIAEVQWRAQEDLAKRPRGKRDYLVLNGSGAWGGDPRLRALAERLTSGPGRRFAVVLYRRTWLGPREAGSPFTPLRPDPRLKGKLLAARLHETATPKPAQLRPEEAPPKATPQAEFHALVDVIVRLYELFARQTGPGVAPDDLFALFKDLHRELFDHLGEVAVAAGADPDGLAALLGDGRRATVVWAGRLDDRARADLAALPAASGRVVIAGGDGDWPAVAGQLLEKGYEEVSHVNLAPKGDRGPRFTVIGSRPRIADGIWPDGAIDPAGPPNLVPLGPGVRRPRHPQRQAPHPRHGSAPAPRTPAPSGLPAELKPLWEALGAADRRALADLAAEVGARAGLPVLTRFTIALARKKGFSEEAGSSLARWLARIAPPIGLPTAWVPVWHALPSAVQQAFEQLVSAVGAAVATAELAERVAGLAPREGGIMAQLLDLHRHPERFDVLGKQLTESVLPLSRGVPIPVWEALTEAERSALADIGAVPGLNALGTLAGLAAWVAQRKKPPGIAELPALLVSFTPARHDRLARLLKNFIAEGAAEPRPPEPPPVPVTRRGGVDSAPIETGTPLGGTARPPAVEQALWQAFPEALAVTGLTLVAAYPRSAVVVGPDGRKSTVVLEVVDDLRGAEGRWSVPRRDSVIDVGDTLRITVSGRVALDAVPRVLAHGLAAGRANLAGDRPAEPGATFLGPDGDLEGRPGPTPTDRGHLAQLAVLGREYDRAGWNLPKRFRVRKAIRELLSRLDLGNAYRRHAVRNDAAGAVVARHLPPTAPGGYPSTRTNLATNLITGFVPAGSAAVVFGALGSPASGFAWGVFGLVNAVHSAFLARNWEIGKDLQIAERRKYDAAARKIDAAASQAERVRAQLAALGWDPADGPGDPAGARDMGPQPDIAQSRRKHLLRFGVPPMAAMTSAFVVTAPFDLSGASALSLVVYAVGAALCLPFAERSRTNVQKGAELREIDTYVRGLDRVDEDVYAAMGERLGVMADPGSAPRAGVPGAEPPMPELSVAANLPDFVQYFSEIVRRGLRRTAAGSVDETAFLAHHLTLFEALFAYGAGKSLVMLPIAIWQLNKLDQLELGHTVARRSFDERDKRWLAQPEVRDQRMRLFEQAESMVRTRRAGPLRRLRGSLLFLGQPRATPEPVAAPGERELRPGFAPRPEWLKTYTRISVGSAGVTVAFVELFGVSPSLAVAALVAGFTGPLVGWRKWWHRRHELDVGDQDVLETNQAKAAEQAAEQIAAEQFAGAQVIMSAEMVAAEADRADRPVVVAKVAAIARKVAGIPAGAEPLPIPRTEVAPIRIAAREYPYGDWASAYEDALREVRRAIETETQRLSPEQPNRDWGDYRTLGARRVLLDTLGTLARRAATYLDDHRRTGNGLLVWEANADLANAIEDYRWLNSPEWPKAPESAPNWPRHPGEDPEAVAAEEAAVRHLRHRDPLPRPGRLDAAGWWQGSAGEAGPGDRHFRPQAGTTNLHRLPALHAGIETAGGHGIAWYLRERAPELRRTNPRHDEPTAQQDGYRSNCTRAVVWYVRRLFGEDVTAPPVRPEDAAVLGSLNYISDRLGGTWDDSHGTSYDSVISAMTARPSGALAVLAVEFRTRGGEIRRHVGLVGNDAGLIVFLDPQEGWLMSLPEDPTGLALLHFTDTYPRPGGRLPGGNLHLPEGEPIRSLMDTPVLREALRTRPETLDALRRNPEATAILASAAAELRARGAEDILRENVLAAPPGPIDLTETQWAAVRAVREGIVSFPDAPPAQPGYHPPDDPSPAQLAGYNAEYLAGLSASWRTDQDRLNELAGRLAAAASGTAGHRDEEKSGVLAEVDRDHRGDASQVTDLAAAYVRFDKVSWIYQALEVLREQLGPAEIVSLEDGFVKPRYDGYRDLRLILRLPHGHLVELRLRLTSIDEAADSARVLEGVADALAGTASRDAQAVEAVLLRRVSELFAEATARGLPQLPPPGPESFADAAESALAKAEPAGCAEFGDRRQSANATYHLTYPGGFRTIYKPASGETRSLGGHLPPGEQGRREVAAYRLARAIGSDAVPPTAYIDGPLGPGSNQLWKEDAAPAEVSAYPRKQHQLIAVLDYVAASLDRSPNDCLTGPAGEAIVIDNGQSFPDYADPLGGIRSGFVAAWFDVPFDPEVLAAVRAIDPGWLVRMLVATGIGEEAADGARDRLEEIQRLGRIGGQMWPARIWDDRWNLVRGFK